MCPAVPGPRRSGVPNEPGASSRSTFLRLWVYKEHGEPGSLAASGRPAITATAYDAAGHVLGQVQLGRMP